MARHYFSAANTPKGFYSCFQNVLPLDAADHIYYIKGGSGCGKSTFMKNIGNAAEEAGLTVEYFHCSSDANSLDGVHIVEKKTAVFDGTAPHTMDPKMCGAVDSIINLGQFLDEEKLVPNRGYIASFMEKKAESYDSAYRYLRAAKELERRGEPNLLAVEQNFYALCETYKLTLFTQTPKRARKLFASGITPQGLVRFDDSLFTGKVIGLEGGADVSLLLSRLAQNAVLCGYDTDVLYCPFSPDDKLEHVIIYPLDLCFTTVNGYHGCEHCESVLHLSEPAPNPDELVLNQLLDKAVESLQSAQSWHRKIEEIYIPAMDFDLVTAKQKELMKTLL